MLSGLLVHFSAKRDAFCGRTVLPVKGAGCAPWAYGGVLRREAGQPGPLWNSLCGMIRFFPSRLVLPLLCITLGATPGLAQEVPLAAQKDLWCGTAFDLMTRDVSTREGKAPAAAAPFIEGSQMLIKRALPIYLESGYSDAALATLRARLEADVARAIDGKGVGESASYSFQECSALIGL